jgi:hypothetical protein
MPSTELIFKDKDGFHYKFPERSCKRCLKYPCVTNMDNLKGNFAAYGCKMFEDENIFYICKSKK